MENLADFTARRQALLRDMVKIATSCGRDSSGIALMAVSKMQDDAALDAALRSGQRLFGENKVQEAARHWAARRADIPDLRLHLIGPLQRNKVADALDLFDCIETIDRIELVDALATGMRALGKYPDCFIQVNIGEEPQKSGVSLRDLPRLIDHARNAGLNITGLMAIPPESEPPAAYFALAMKLAARYGLGQVSMGMSRDYAQAIRLGATTIRVGTALFGVRAAI